MARGDYNTSHDIYNMPSNKQEFKIMQNVDSMMERTIKEMKRKQ